MKDDDLMAELFEAHSRTDAADALRDPLWEKLAAGTISGEERRTLDEKVRTDASLRDAIDLLSPMGEAFEARVVAKIEAAKAAPARRNDAPGATAPSANVLIFRRRAMGVIGALSVAAAVAFLAIRVPSAVGGNSEGALPKYAMVVTGGQKDVRSIEPAAPSTGEEIVRVGPDSELSLVFRPAESVLGGDIGMRALLVRDGRAETWEPPVNVSTSGVVQIAGPASSLGLGAPGDVSIVVAVGRGLPADPRILLNPPPEGAPPGATYQIFRANLRVSAR